MLQDAVAMAANTWKPAAPGIGGTPFFVARVRGEERPFRLLLVVT